MKSRLIRVKYGVLPFYGEKSIEARKIALSFVKNLEEN